MQYLSDLKRCHDLLKKKILFTDGVLVTKYSAGSPANPYPMFSQGWPTVEDG